MANTPVSAPIAALLEQLGAAMTGAAPAPTPATLYAQLIRIRDEAELLEVRASARDAKVRELLAELAAAADRLERIDTSNPSWCGVDMARGPSAYALVIIHARRAGKTVAIEDAQAELQRRWGKIRCDHLALRDASQGDQP